MKMKKVILMSMCCLLIVSATFFTGCDKGNETPASITVENQQTLTQTVFADNTQGAGSVNFVTTGAWTSSIANGTAPSASSAAKVAAAAASGNWISINPASGDKAGNYTITIMLEPNTTGADRTAVITIACEGTEIAITVTQKGTKEDGTVPETGGAKLVTRIERFESDTASVAGDIYVFEYDSQNRLTAIKQNSQTMTSIDYSTPNTIRCSGSNWSETTSYTLNSKGYIADNCTYSSEGYLTNQSSPNSSGTAVYSWENGNLKSYVASIYVNGSDGETYWGDETLNYEYSTLLNKPCGIDLAQFITGVSGSSSLPLYDLWGKSVKNLPVRKEEQPWYLIWNYVYEIDTEGYVTKVTDYDVYKIKYNN
jgi:hypothetical protein